MTTLSYSHTLVAGTPENVNDVQDMFNDVKTLVNGNLDATNLATSAKPSNLMGVYRTVEASEFFVASGSAATCYFAVAGGLISSGSTVAGSNVPQFIGVDEVPYKVTGLTVKMRLRVAFVTNAVAPTGTFTFGLYPVTTAGGAGNLTTTLGTVVSGSTVAHTAPAASSQFLDAGSDFTPPTAGVYVLGVVTPAMAANSAVVGKVFLEVHNV
jgi:hypothetical protein